MRRATVAPLLAVLVAGLAGCRRAPSPEAAAYSSPASAPVVRAYMQFSPGDTLELVRIQMGLDRYEVRYRSSMPEGMMGMVVFMDDGNLHIDARKVGETWVLVSVPLLDPSNLPAADRVAEWDRGADAQKSRSASER